MANYSGETIWRLRPTPPSPRSLPTRSERWHWCWLLARMCSGRGVLSQLKRIEHRPHPISPGPDSPLIRCLTEFLLSDIAKIQLIFPIRSGLYQSPGFRSVRERYIEISRLLDTTPPGPERSRLVKEMHELER